MSDPMWTDRQLELLISLCRESYEGHLWDKRILAEEVLALRAFARNAQVLLRATEDGHAHAARAHYNREECAQCSALEKDFGQAHDRFAAALAILGPRLDFTDDRQEGNQR
jgi:hypothetical protein